MYIDGRSGTGTNINTEFCLQRRGRISICSPTVGKKLFDRAVHTQPIQNVTHKKNTKNNSIKIEQKA